MLADEKLLITGVITPDLITWEAARRLTLVAAGPLGTPAVVEGALP
jgi:hypothetical protein